MLGMLLSTGLAFGPSLAVLVALALYILGTIPRIRMEERLLNQTFVKQYARYSRRDPPILPLRWHRNKA
jgi:protein-S-isoprenylcysteine O-methyltransferase Ste14